jgi:hypothetical protein
MHWRTGVVGIRRPGAKKVFGGGYQAQRLMCRVLFAAYGARVRDYRFADHIPNIKLF